MSVVRPFGSGTPWVRSISFLLLVRLSIRALAATKRQHHRLPFFKSVWHTNIVPMQVSVNKFKEIRKAGFKKKDLIKKERKEAKYLDYLHKCAITTPKPISSFVHILKPTRVYFLTLLQGLCHLMPSIRCRQICLLASPSPMSKSCNSQLRKRKKL